MRPSDEIRSSPTPGSWEARLGCRRPQSVATRARGSSTRRPPATSSSRRGGGVPRMKTPKAVGTRAVQPRRATPSRRAVEVHAQPPAGSGRAGGRAVEQRQKRARGTRGAGLCLLAWPHPSSLAHEARGVGRALAPAAETAAGGLQGPAGAPARGRLRPQAASSAALPAAHSGLNRPDRTVPQV